MKSLKFAARRGAIFSAAALSALALASCSAGQTTQTAQKVIAVDGSHATTEDGSLAVQDVNILLEPDTGAAALKFSAINKSYTDKDVVLKSIDVDGQTINLSGIKPMGRDATIVGNSKANLSDIPRTDADNIQYVATPLENDDFGYAGTRPVTFNFSTGTITVDAPISASPLKSGSHNRDPKSVKGYTTETAAPGGHGEGHSEGHAEGNDHGSNAHGNEAEGH